LPPSKIVDRLPRRHEEIRRDADALDAAGGRRAHRSASIEKGEASIKGRGGGHCVSPASAREMIDVVLCPASSGTRRVFPP
jgi:hypothetical protein